MQINIMTEESQKSLELLKDEFLNRLAVILNKNGGNPVSVLNGGHYVTVTGVEEYSTSDGTKIMLEISSWGRKYYVNYDEYLEYVRKNDNFYFSNILYIKKKIKKK